MASTERSVQTHCDKCDAPADDRMSADTRLKYERMAQLYRDGKTMPEIANILGCAKSSVSTGIRKVTRPDRDMASLEKWGCPYEQYRMLVKHPDRPTDAYQGQKANALQRGVSFEITLWQWWVIWQESGHWHQRGRRDGQYVMCRNGDTGPYAIGNVYIASQATNKTDGKLFRLENQLCKRGHEYSAANTYLSNGSRCCRACARLLYRQKQNASSSPSPNNA